MNNLILIAAVSFGLGGMVGGIVVHMHEGKLNAYEQMAYEQMLFDEHIKEQKQAEESARGQREDKGTASNQRRPNHDHRG